MLLLATSCGGSARVSFRATDTTFQPRPGGKPSVYLRASEVPNTPMRSVGIIAVTVPESSGISGASNAAAAKGQELGCAMLIEHSVFESTAGRGALSFGARVYFAHGPSGHGGGPQRPSSGSLTAEFDCVFAAEPPRA